MVGSGRGLIAVVLQAYILNVPVPDFGLVTAILGRFFTEFLSQYT